MTNSKYTPELATVILKRVSECDTLRQVARDLDIPESSIREWARSDRDGFAAQYAQARAMQVDAWADEIVAVAYDERLDPATARVRIDTLKFLLSKLAPRRFGDRLLVAGDPENPLQMLHRKVSLDTMSDAQLEELDGFCQRMIAAQQD